MLLFNRLGGGEFSENATLLSKIDDLSKLLRRVALFDGHADGVLEMLLFNRLGGGKFSENATLLSKIDESSKLLRRVALLDRHPDGVLEMLLFSTFQSARPTGRGPRNVIFQLARPPDGRDRLCRL